MFEPQSGPISPKRRHPTGEFEPDSGAGEDESERLRSNQKQNGGQENFIYFTMLPGEPAEADERQQIGYPPRPESAVIWTEQR